MATFINTTPHVLTIRANGTDTVVPTSEYLARCSVEQVRVADVAGIPTFVNQYGAVKGMPSPTILPDGTYVLVSAMVLAQLDPTVWSGLAFAPDTGKTAIRNEAGQVVAVTQLVGC